MSELREASVEPDRERLPGGAPGQAGPFLILGVAALWLRARWGDLPDRVPVHWNWRGQPTRFVPHTPLAVAVPLLIGLALCLLLLCFQFGLRHGAARGELRRSALRLLVTGEYFSAALCWATLAAAVFGGRLLAPVVAVSLAGAVALVIATASMIRRVPRAKAHNPAAWRAGLFYLDRDDPALFVPKRLGYGYTFNFGNPLAVPILLALLGLPLLAVVLGAR